MCGLVGMVTHSENGAFMKDSETFHDLLYMDALRGMDSTGVAMFDRWGEINLIKDAVEASSFRYYKQFQELLRTFGQRGKAIIGHNRKQTVGKSTSEQAHPFAIDGEKQIPEYVFMHNGTLTNHAYLEKNLAQNLGNIGVKMYTEPTSGVDSEILGTMLTRCDGDKQKLEDMLNLVGGAYACVWIDQKREKLCLLKNKERTLCLAHTDAGLFFASEPGFIIAAASRHGIKVSSYEPVEDHTLYEVNLNGAGCAITKTVLSVKKSLPPVILTPGKTTKGGNTSASDTTMTDEKGGMSKASFRRFRARNGIHHGKEITFSVDDYVEHVPGAAEPRDYHVWGTCPDIAENHCVMTDIENMREDELEQLFDDVVVKATVDRVDYNKKLKCIEIWVKDLKRMEQTHENSPTVH